MKVQDLSLSRVRLNWQDDFNLIWIVSKNHLSSEHGEDACSTPDIKNNLDVFSSVD